VHHTRVAIALAVIAAIAACGDSKSSHSIDAPVTPPTPDAPVTPPVMDPVKDSAAAMIDEGRQTFRFDTFGDEDFWGGVLKLHQAVATVSPAVALSVGLKVDVDAVPPAVATGIMNGSVDLNDPANTLALLKANAVVGVTGFFDSSGALTSIGIQCALCHSTVDDSFAPGIGHRLDGWANRDLNVGAIVALAPDLSVPAAQLGVSQDTLRTVLHSWGPGKFDAEVFLDGKAFRPDNTSAATLIPPAFNLDGVNLHTWTGWGSLTYWNAFVATLEMHGHGTFIDSRLDDSTKFPVAAANGFGHITSADDRVTPKLAALHFYQLAIRSPAPPASSYDAAAAMRGQAVFDGKAKCSSCHAEPLMTEPGWNMHTGDEIGIDNFQADRSPDGRYRTAPLHGLWTHEKGGFYHDGRFATLLDVVNHYDTFFTLGLTDAEKGDLVEYLKSL
jgi:cytochrome c5